MEFKKIILTVGYIGYFPFAPGTMGALAGVSLSYVIYLQFPYIIGQIILFMLVGFFTTLGAYLSGKYNLILFGKEDPGKVVIDEVAGVMIATSLPNIIIQEQVGWGYFLAGFLLFRFFDITKTFGIRQLEKVPNGWGVMLDDTLAGIWSLVLLILYQFYQCGNILKLADT